MKNAWRWLVAIAVTVGLLWWVLRDFNWADVREKLAGANIALVVASVAVATMVYPLRALRWRPILDSVSPNLPFGPLWRATTIGFMANSVLPSGRVGEFVRPFVLSRETAVPFTAGLASLVADRVFDVIAVALLTLVPLLDPAFPSSGDATGYLTAGVAFIGVVIAGAFTISFFPDPLIRLFESVARRLIPRFAAKGAELLRTFAAGMAVLRSPRRFLVVLAWALAMWLTQALGFWIMMIALGIDVPFTAALFVQGLIVLAVAVPSTPGYFGVFEAAGAVGLGAYGVSTSLGVAWGFIFHVLSLIPILVIGLYYLAKSGMKLADLRQLKQ